MFKCNTENEVNRFKFNSTSFVVNIQLHCKTEKNVYKCQEITFNYAENLLIINNTDLFLNFTFYMKIK